MHAAKEKVKDMASEAKEKVREGTAKTEERAEKATARNEQEKEMAKERAKAKEAEAKAELHREKAEHRADSAAHHGGTHVPLTRDPHHARPVGIAAVPAGTAPAYPASGDRLAGEKYP